MTLSQIVSLLIVFFVGGFILRYARGLFRWGLTIITVLVVFGGYTWYEAAKVPLGVAQKVISHLNLDKVQESVRYENGNLAVQVADGQWVN